MSPATADPKVVEGALLMVPTRVVHIKDAGNILLEVRGGVTGTTTRFTLAAADLERDAIPTAVIVSAVDQATDREAEIDQLTQYVATMDAQNGQLRELIASLTLEPKSPLPVPVEQPIVVVEPTAPEPTGTGKGRRSKGRVA